MGKSTISTGPFSIAMLVYQRVPKCATELVEISFPTDGAFCCISVKLASLDSAGRCAIHGFSWRNSHEKKPSDMWQGRHQKVAVKYGEFSPPCERSCAMYSYYSCRTKWSNCIYPVAAQLDADDFWWIPSHWGIRHWDWTKQHQTKCKISLPDMVI